MGKALCFGHVAVLTPHSHPDVLYLFSPDESALTLHPETPSSVPLGLTILCPCLQTAQYVTFPGMVARRCLRCSSDAGHRSAML